MTIRYKLIAAVLISMVPAPAHAEEQIAWTNIVGRYEVTIVESWTSSPRDGTFSVHVRDQRKQTRIIPLDLAVGSLGEVAVWAQRRLLVTVGNFLLSVVDLESATLLDQFVVARRAISPNGRFVAFTRFLPRTVERVEDVVLLYDLASDSSLNRMHGGDVGTARLQDTGVAVFPEWFRANRQYQYSEGTAVTNGLRSPIVWLNDHSFVFLNWARTQTAAGTIEVVRVDVNGNSANVNLHRTTLDAAALVDTTRYEVATEPSNVVVARQILPLGATPPSRRVRIVLDTIPGRLRDFFDIEIN